MHFKLKRFSKIFLQLKTGSSSKLKESCTSPKNPASFTPRILLTHGG